MPIEAASRRVLDFDIETVAAGFADPQWVPNTVIAWAYAWEDAPHLVESRVLPVRSWHNTTARARFLKPLVAAMAEADVLTGHNIVRFDLPVLNAECMRLNVPFIGSTLVQDTIRFPRTKGFKKGLDNIAVLLGAEEEKRPLNWQEWQDAYGETGMPEVQARVESDVRLHLEVREKMRERGWLRPPARWRA